MLKKTDYVENEEDIKSELESVEWHGLNQTHNANVSYL